MPIDGNLFGDLLKIGGGDAELVTERMAQYLSYANTVPAQPSPSVAPATETPAAAPQVAHRQAG